MSTILNVKLVNLGSNPMTTRFGILQAKGVLYVDEQEASRIMRIGKGKVIREYDSNFITVEESIAKVVIEEENHIVPQDDKNISEEENEKVVKLSLLAKAQENNIKIDKRWSIAKIEGILKENNIAF
jgi:hypothetical protein